MNKEKYKSKKNKGRKKDKKEKQRNKKIKKQQQNKLITYGRALTMILKALTTRTVPQSWGVGELGLFSQEFL